MNNPFYDPKLRPLCRDTMRGFIRLYCEFGFKLDDVPQPPEIVAKINDLSAEVDDESITDDRLAVIFQYAVGELHKQGNLGRFCLLPILFIRKELTIASDLGEFDE